MSLMDNTQADLVFENADPVGAGLFHALSTNGNRRWSRETIALVTGANKGIGFEVVKQLAEHGLSVILTARNQERGLAAKYALKKLGLEVDFHVLDVTSDVSLSKLAQWIKKKYGGLDILVNNAAIAYWSFKEEKFSKMKQTIETNYGGVKKTIETLLPLLRSSITGAKIINVSSYVGQLELIKNARLREELSDVEALSQEKLDGFVYDYLDAVKQGRDIEEGWPSGYALSKSLVNAYTRLLHQRLKERPKIYVNCMQPGLVKTDLNPYGEITPDEGADTVVWLALRESEGPSGMFFYERKQIKF